jgi:hypothetical protein
LLVCLVVLFISLVLVRGFLHLHSKDETANRLEWVLGIVAGVMVASKITSAPLVAMVIFPYRGYRRCAILLGVTGLSVIVSLIPILSVTPRLFSWFSSLATHTGTYGSGPVGFIDRQLYWNGLRALLESAKVLPWMIGIGLLTGCASFLTRNKRIRSLGRWLLACALIEIISTCLIAKHASPHYLMPTMVATGINIVLLILMVGEIRSRLMMGVVILGIAFGLYCGCRQAAAEYEFRMDSVREQAKRPSEVLGKVTDLAGKHPIVEYYTVSSLPFALQMGNGWARQRYAERLEKLYPNYFIFNIFNGQYMTFGHFIDPKVLYEKYEEIYLFGSTDLSGFLARGEVPLPAGWMCELTLKVSGVYGTYVYRIHRVTK